MILDSHNDVEDNQTFTVKSPFLKNLIDLNINVPEPMSLDIQNFDKLLSRDSKLCIMSLNCCSLLSKILDLKSIISEFNRTPDIICLQEIFYFPDNFDINLDNYVFYFKQRSFSRGGGVGIYVHKRFQVEILNSDFAESIFESILIKLKYDDKSWILGNFYRPPKSSFETFSNLYVKFLDYINSFNIRSYICCDSNIDLLKVNETQSDFFECNLSFGFVNVINQATRFAFPSKTAIDQIFTNDVNSICNSGIITESPSDHFFTFLFVSDQFKCKISENVFYSRDFRNSKIELFNDVLKNYDWSCVFSSMDANIAANNFMNSFITLYNIHFPLKVRKINKSKTPVEPWFTKGLLTSRKKKLKLFKQYKKKGSDVTKNAFFVYRNMYNKLCKEAKHMYYSDQLSRTKISSKKHWKLIKEAAGLSNNNSDSINALKNADGEMITDSIEIANFFNDYFASIGKKTSQSVPPTNTDFKKFLKYNVNSFIFLSISPFEVAKIVHELHDKDTKDINDISVSFLKKSIYYLAEPLAHIFNCSISTGVFPDIFKMNKTIPVFKKNGNKHNVSDYRPISIVNSFAKILEKYTSNMLMNFLYRNNLISSRQYGFLRHKSTSDCLFDIIGNVCKNASNDMYTALILLDISKAFDTCKHSVLIEKLFAYGVRGTPLEFFKSFLTNRTQKVKVGNMWSSFEKHIDIGVPQGSEVGVLLFLIMINDLPTSTDFYTCCYADDSSAMLSASNISELESRCNFELRKIDDWFRCNNLLLNLKKSNFIVYSPSLSHSPKIKLYFESDHEKVSIEQVPNEKNKSVKVLGLHLDEKFLFKEHLSYIRKKINQSLFFISRVKNCISLEARKLLYFSHVHSRLLYCLPLFTSMRLTDMNALCRLQKKALKIVYNVKQRSSSLHLFHDIGILPVDKMLNMHIIKLMHKIYLHNSPSHMSSYFSLKNYHHSYLLRKNTRYEIPLIKSIRLTTCPIFQYAITFNNFPLDIKFSWDRSHFLEQINNFFYSDYKSDECTKQFCKICDPVSYKMKQRSYICSPFTPEYYHY